MAKLSLNVSLKGIMWINVTVIDMFPFLGHTNVRPVKLDTVLLVFSCQLEEFSRNVSWRTLSSYLHVDCIYKLTENTIAKLGTVHYLQ